MEATMANSTRSILLAAAVAMLAAGCADVPYDSGYYGYNDPYAYNDYPGYYGPGYVEPGPSVGFGFGFWDSDHHWHEGHRDFDRDHDRGHFDRDHDRGGHDDHGSGG
jgi:hypothetical protein